MTITTNSHSSSTKKHRIPRRASTVIIARDNDIGTIDLFVQQRQPTMNYAANALVFPGGGVEDTDYIPQFDGYTGMSTQAHRDMFARRLCTESSDMTAFVNAAQREVYEETTIDLHQYQHTLIPIDRWITPDVPAFKRRYDTATFVLKLEQDTTIQPQHSTTEASMSYWASPQEILRSWEHGEITLLPPTWWHLCALAQFNSVHELYDNALSPHHGPAVFHDWVIPEHNNLSSVRSLAHFYDRASITGRHHGLIHRPI